MDKQQAKQILKNTGYIGNEVGVAFDVATKSMDKLEQIERIINDWKESAERDIEMYDTLEEIAKVLEKE
jgi:hypothetical protein